MSRKYLRWSEVPYAGEHRPPKDAVTPQAGSWPLVYFERDHDGHFLDPDGKRMNLPIKNPRDIDFYKELHTVQDVLANLTPHQRKIGTYYGSGVPTKQWTPLIDRLIDTYGVGPTDAARLLSEVQGAINDAMVIAWHFKYKWDAARPNQYDQDMETLLCTPRFPTYPSGHATMSGCTQVVLSYFFPREARKLEKIADDNALSRLYAGVHFPSDNEEGLNLGRFLGMRVVEQLKKERKGMPPFEGANRIYRNAEIFPDRYKQFIPYDFPKTCSSKTISERAALKPHEDWNDNTKPRLFY